MFRGMVKLFREFQKLQSELKKIQKELARLQVTGSSGGGMVEVTFNGKLEVLKVKIDKKIFEERNTELLESLVAGAVNQGIQKVQELIKERLQLKAEETPGISQFSPPFF